ncbi:hypothetical protein BDY21DRAFT_38913 [Lineolata rhizophorae]|uniref:CDP-alcohol phosphatidyltransferase-domain-containing protein n=1 Tax=Lineolata rhizophorae TaxID=578093 RepID=A0A6A6P0R1_9PEZI|nr:hypothetical protein BDY21DRAFT_38913 [Lineolata rhizophorae]
MIGLQLQSRLASGARQAAVVGRTGLVSPSPLLVAAFFSPRSFLSLSPSSSSSPLAASVRETVTRKPWTAPCNYCGRIGRTWSVSRTTPFLGSTATRIRSSSATGHATDNSLYDRYYASRGRLFSSETQKWSEKKPPKPPLRETTRVISERVKSRLSSLTPHENIYTLPNFLTFSRLLAAPVIGYLVLHSQDAAALALFAYAGATDLIDGWIARTWQLQTVVGSVVDPLADKALMAVLVTSLAAKGALPLWLAALVFGRDASLGLAAVYFRWASLAPPKTWARYWDFSLPSAEVHPTRVSKANTFLQLVLIGATMTLPLVAGGDGAIAGTATAYGVGAEEAHAVVAGLQYLVAGTTLWSGASYVWTKSAVRILGDDETLKKKQGIRGRAIIGLSFAACVALAGSLAVRDESQSEKGEEVEDNT